jgi:hypothetical protein
LCVALRLFECQPTKDRHQLVCRRAVFRVPPARSASSQVDTRAPTQTLRRPTRSATSRICRAAVDGENVPTADFLDDR